MRLSIAFIAGVASSLVLFKSWDFAYGYLTGVLTCWLTAETCAYFARRERGGQK